MPDNIILVGHYEVQCSITEYDKELKHGVTMLLLGDGTLEALFQPELVAIGAVVHGAEGANS